MAHRGAPQYEIHHRWGTKQVIKSSWMCSTFYRTDSVTRLTLAATLDDVGACNDMGHLETELEEMLVGAWIQGDRTKLVLRVRHQAVQLA